MRACLLAITLLWFAGPLQAADFPRPLESYHDAGQSVAGQLTGRIAAEPFNLVATLLFLLAIIHTFLAGYFLRWAHRADQRRRDLEKNGDPDLATLKQIDHLRFRGTVLHLLGEVEAIFGLWVIPLSIAIVCFHGWSAMVHYIDGVNYTEPIFVFVVMALASARPVLRFAEGCLATVASIGRGSPAAWWLAILTVGPLLGSFITEPAAMTICALLLIRQFFRLKPSMTLRYATLGLLFVNISVGGTLTHFAAPPVVMVAQTWDWGSGHMFLHFGWKAIVGILAANAVYFILFRKELLGLRSPGVVQTPPSEKVPPFVTTVHLLLIAWTVISAHHPALVIGGLLLFLAFTLATDRHQNGIALRGPMLVGFFLAALVIHGGFQQWWIAPVLGSLGRWPLMIGATLLTAVNDNAAITYLATLVPNFSDALKYAVVAGAVAGGGLTVIANAPNPAGQSILQREFGEDGVQPLKLFLAALFPTLVMVAALMFLP